ncbi:MAG: hypothetical protein WCR56_02830 [Bacilli bacterium]|jgi:hypothetical protein
MSIGFLKNRLVLNPFFWFALVWTITLAFYSLNLVTVYPQIPLSLLAFFIGIIVISIVLIFVYNHLFLGPDKSIFVLRESKPSYWLAVICALAFLAAVFYSKMVPLIEIFKGNQGSYKSFGIPSFTFLAVTLTLALSSLSSVKLAYGSDHKGSNACCILLCYLIFILSYSRGILILAFLITFILLLSKHHANGFYLLGFILIAIIGLLIFNIAGNIRQKSAWNDSSYIMGLAGFNEDYYFLKDFSWGLIYICSPLGNLTYNYLNVAVDRSFSGMLSQLLPDFLSKRILPGYSADLFLAQPQLTVSSMFAGGYKYGGLFGMFLSYLELILMIFVVAFLTKDDPKYFLASSASLSIISALTFFDNMVTYSGFSLFLVYFVIGRFYEKKQNQQFTIVIVDPPKELLINDN